jgi:DNA-binding NarL/FixJ family response regulator/two-component sensor histidine kinase
VANIVATAIERSRASERLIDVRDAERRRIARDLHDDALQDLAYALAEADLPLSAPDGSEAAQRLSRLVPALRRVGEQLRGAVYDLRLAGDEARTFRDLLEALVDVHRAMAPACQIVLDLEDGPWPGSLGRTGTEVLRIVGEALTNSRRHAGAGHADVRVRATEHRLRAEVSDDGRGFAAVSAAASATSDGITGMRERAHLLGGELDVASRPGGGTAVRLDIPLRKDGERPAVELRVLLVEDHAAVREAIAATFQREAGFEIVGQAASLGEARALLLDIDVDVAILDLGLPDGYGADLIDELRERNPRAQALVLSASVDRADIAAAVQRGAAGVLNKAERLDDIVAAVRRLRAGETLLPVAEVVELLQFAGRRRVREQADRQAIAQLTPREHEVLQALADGLDSRQVAERLFISIRTERNHVANILGKLGVHSQLQALLFALRYDVVQVQ